jgi:hypothetical protein
MRAVGLPHRALDMIGRDGPLSLDGEPASAMSQRSSRDISSGLRNRRPRPKFTVYDASRAHWAGVCGA